MAYQKYISPHKGFCCAHRVHNGSDSCSAWAIRIIKKHGLFLLIPLMLRRFKACANAYKEIEKEAGGKNEKGKDAKETAGCCLAVWPFY